MAMAASGALALERAGPASETPQLWIPAEQLSPAAAVWRGARMHRLRMNEANKEEATVVMGVEGPLVSRIFGLGLAGQDYHSAVADSFVAGVELARPLGNWLQAKSRTNALNVRQMPSAGAAGGSRKGAGGLAGCASCLTVVADGGRVFINSKLSVRAEQAGPCSACPRCHAPDLSFSLSCLGCAPPLLQARQSTGCCWGLLPPWGSASWRRATCLAAWAAPTPQRATSMVRCWGRTPSRGRWYSVWCSWQTAAATALRVPSLQAPWVCR